MTYQYYMTQNGNYTALLVLWIFMKPHILLPSKSDPTKDVYQKINV